MDISDILASVSSGSGPQEVSDHHLLTRLWVSERLAPELLPYPDELIARTSARIARQVELLEELLMGEQARAGFKIVVMQTELERVKFMVRSFLRARLAKVSSPFPRWCSGKRALC